MNLDGYADIACRADVDGLVCSLMVESNNPCFEGHFPANPVLPAIAQLVLVEQLIRGVLGEDHRIGTLRQVRFSGLIRPGDRLTIECVGLGESGTGSFRIRRDDVLVTSGSLTLKREVATP